MCNFEVYGNQLNWTLYLKLFVFQRWSHSDIRNADHQK